VEIVQRLPSDWLTLVERIVPQTAVDEQEPETGLRSGTQQNDERSLTWL
jgi:hypothetical protein